MSETVEAGSTGSDAELITRVRAGDRAAYGELYARHSAAALTLARQFSRSSAEADDLVSESFARVLDTLIAGGGPDSAFRAYLFTTLRNTAYDRTRRDQRLQFTDDVEAHDVPVETDDPVLLQAENSLVGKAFSALPERWQAVLWYTQVDGLSPAETGVLLGMSANAVTSLAYRAREGLRESYLQAHLADTAAERCRSTVDRLGAWARGGLSKREQAQVDAHLSDCDRCRALAAELTEINSGIRVLIAPLLLGGAAAGYLATTSGTPMALLSAGTLFTAHTAVAGSAATGSASTGAAAGAAAGSGATGGAVAGTAAAGAGAGHAAGAIGSFWTRPWVLASGGLVAAAAAVVTAIVVITAGGRAPDGAELPPPVTSAPTQTAGVTDGAAGGTTGAPPGGTAGTGTGTGGASTSPVPSTPSATVTATTPTTTVATTVPTSTAGGNQGVSRSEVAPPPIIVTTSGQAGSTSVTAQPSTTSPGPSTTTAPTTATTTPPGTTATSTTATSTTAPTSTTTTTQPTTSPAALSAPQFDVGVVAATAGAATSVTFTVQNTGQTDSDPQTALVSTPRGVALVGGSGQVASSSASPLRRFSALLAPLAAPAEAAASAADPVTCDTASCGYVVPANSTITVTLDLSVAADAADGTIVVSTGGPGDASVLLTVAPGLTGLQIIAPTTSWIAGTTITAGLTGTLTSPDVTDVGTIVLPVRQGTTWITSYPKTCTPPAGVPLTISCTATVAGGTADFGSFGLSLLPGAQGDLAIEATLPGSHPPVTLGDETGGPISITPLTTDGAISLTGPFGGAMVSTPTMSCAAAKVQRNDIAHCAMTTFPDLPSLTVPGTSDDRILWARLVWAATQPVRGKDLSSLDVSVDGTSVTVAGTPTAAGQVGSVYSWVGELPTDLTPGQKVSIPSFPADSTLTNQLSMGGWALVVVWADDSATASQATVNVQLPRVGLPNDGTRHDASTPNLAAVSTAQVLLFGTDAVGEKKVCITGSSAADSCLTYSGSVADPFAGPLAGTDESPISHAAETAVGMDNATVTASGAAGSGVTVTGQSDSFLWAALLTTGPASSGG